jgi:DNA polymerase III delta prime subunit
MGQEVGGLILYVEKYEPKTLEDMIGNVEIKECFLNKKTSELTHYIFDGPPGTGKSLTAKLIAKKHFPGNYREKNMSLGGRKIEAIESEIIEYCELDPRNGQDRKMLILTEADGISKPAQKAFRMPMETYGYKVPMILTCNYGHKIIDAIHSRACTMRFKLASHVELMEYANRIIDGEKLEISQAQLKGIIRQARGKFRNVANILQGWTSRKKVYYKDKKDLQDKINSSFAMLKELEQDQLIQLFEDMILEYESNDIIFELMQRVRDDKMPRRLKSLLLTSCADCAERITRIDPYIAFWQLAAKSVEIVRALKRK